MEKEYSRREFLKKTGKLTGLAALSLIPFGCATRPDVRGGKIPGTNKHYTINQSLDVAKITEENSRYHTHGVTIFGEGFYHAKTPIGNALFNADKAIESTLYNVNKKGEIVGETSIVSGEGGLYFLDPALDKKGKMIDKVTINSEYKKAIVQNPVVIKKEGDWGVFCETEEDSKFEIGLGKLSGKFNYAIRVEDEKRGEEGFYDFYVTPLVGSRKETDKKGRITIRHEDKIFRPKFYSWEKIRETISFIEERNLMKNAQKVIEELGLPKKIKAIKVEDINNH